MKDVTEHLIDNRFAMKLKNELRVRLNREPTIAERINGDKDADLVLEIYWQLITEMMGRIEVLEKELGITPNLGITES